MFRKIGMIFFLLFFINLFAFCEVKSNYSVQSPESSVEMLLKRINNRLEFAQYIAAYKYYNKLSPELMPFEKKAIGNLLQESGKKGINIKSLQRYLIVEILLEKYLQKSWMEWWNRFGFPKDYKVKNLTHELVPQLDTLDVALAQSLGEAAPFLEDSNIKAKLFGLANQLLNAPFMTPRSKSMIANALTAVKMKKRPALLKPMSLLKNYFYSLL